MFVRLALVCCFAFFTGFLYAQDTVSASDPRKPAIDTTIALYHQFTDKQSRLYNGPEHIPYAPSLEGHAYFLDKLIHKGTVVYDGMIYNDVKMQYDLIRDNLVIVHFDGFFRMNLVTEKVKEFSFNDHHYVRLERDSANGLPFATGFYDKLYSGKLMVLAKRTKRIEETVTDKVIQKVTEKNFYYVYNGKEYNHVRSFKSLLSNVKDRSKEVRQYLRKSKIRYRKDRENAIVKAIEYYDSLKK